MNNFRVFRVNAEGSEPFGSCYIAYYIKRLLSPCSYFQIETDEFNRRAMLHFIIIAQQRFDVGD